jgi:hypothetical protein
VQVKDSNSQTASVPLSITLAKKRGK